MNPPRCSEQCWDNNIPKLFVSTTENSPDGGGAIERGILVENDFGKDVFQSTYEDRLKIQTVNNVYGIPCSILCIECQWES